MKRSTKVNDVVLMRTVVCVTTLALLCWLAGFIAFTHTITKLKTMAPSEKADAIIVLTGGSGRIARGLELFSDNYASQIFITGVNTQVKMADIVSLWKGEHLDSLTCCITLGHQAGNTHQNAAEAQKWVNGVQDVHSAYIVTSSYHMPRTMMEFADAMPHLKLIPHVVEYGVNNDKKNFWHLAFSEYNKTLLTWLRVHI
jgi:uncharacterized SAM-binding protein YcdF (DUF218 family)